MTHSAVLRDRYGLTLSTASAVAVERYVEGIDQLLSYNVGAAENLGAAAEADEGFALAHAARAFVFQQQGRVDDAKQSAERARALAGGATRREQRHVEAIALTVAGENGRAMAVVREHLAEFPRDALLAWQGTSLISFSGRDDREQERHAFLRPLAPAYGDDWWFLGSLGFACHELDRFEESRRLSERSLELYPRNANGSHNLAHVALETTDHAAGAGFLASWLVDYDRAAPFHSHLSWHLALFELTAGRYSRVMELYDTAICPTAAAYRLAFLDASSLLWRLQLYGCTDGPLDWKPVCELAGQIAPRPGMAFSDAHVALAYAAADDQTAMDRLIDGLRDLEAKGHPLAGGVTLPLTLGVNAFARGDYGEAVHQLEPVHGQMHRIGGSHAQWELFEETLIEAELRAGEFEKAATLLQQRLARRSSPRDLFWLGRAQVGLGVTRVGTASLREAKHLWAGAEADGPEQAALAALQGDAGHVSSQGRQA